MICMCCMEDKLHLQTCGHKNCNYYMCQECIQEWTSRKSWCPHCQQSWSHQLVQHQTTPTSRFIDQSACIMVYWLWGYFFIHNILPISSNYMFVHLFMGIIGSIGLTFMVAIGSFLYHMNDVVFQP